MRVQRGMNILLLYLDLFLVFSISVANQFQEVTGSGAGLDEWERKVPISSICAGGEQAFPGLSNYRSVVSGEKGQ